MARSRAGRSLHIDFAKLSSAMRRCRGSRSAGDLAEGQNEGAAQLRCVGEFRVHPKAPISKQESFGVAVRAPLRPTYLGRATGADSQFRSCSGAPRDGQGQSLVGVDPKPTLRPYRPQQTDLAPLAVPRSRESQGPSVSLETLSGGSRTPLWRRPLRWLLRMWR